MVDDRDIFLFLLLLLLALFVVVVVDDALFLLLVVVEDDVDFLTTDNDEDEEVFKLLHVFDRFRTTFRLLFRLRGSADSDEDGVSFSSCTIVRVRDDFLRFGRAVVPGISNVATLMFILLLNNDGLLWQEKCDMKASVDGSIKLKQIVTRRTPRDMDGGDFILEKGLSLR